MINRIAGYRSAHEQAIAEFGAAADLKTDYALMDHPPKLPQPRTDAQRKADFLVLAWAVSLVVSFVLGMAAGKQ